MNLYKVSENNKKLHEKVCKRIGEALEKHNAEERKFFSSISMRVSKGIMMDHEPTYHGMCPYCQKPMGNREACYCKHCGQLVDKEPLEEYLDDNY